MKSRITLSPARLDLRSPALTEFDPTQPEDGALIYAEVLRDQFNSLAAMIGAISSVNAAQVDTTSTLPPGYEAYASVSVDANMLHFTFGIPQGQQGETGPQGSQGEVSQAALDSAIQGTSPNTNGIGTLDTWYPDPYLEEIRAKLNEVIINGRR